MKNDLTISRAQVATLLKTPLRLVVRLIDTGILKEYKDKNTGALFLLKAEVNEYIYRQGMKCPKCGKIMVMYHVSLNRVKRTMIWAYKCYEVGCGHKERLTERVIVPRKKRGIKPFLTDIRRMHKKAEREQVENQRKENLTRGTDIIGDVALELECLRQIADLKLSPSTKYLLVWNNSYKEFSRQPLIRNATLFAEGLKAFGGVIVKMRLVEDENRWEMSGKYLLPSFEYETKA